MTERRLPEAAYWLAFSLVPGLGAARIQHLCDQFDSLERAWHAHATALQNTELPKNALDALLTFRVKCDPATEWLRVQRSGATLLTLADDGYPASLRKITAPPPVLFVRGALLPQDERALAIVGTRSATHYGQEATRRIARELALQGVTIVSGLAQGIDVAAHEAALAAGGRTIAVFGSGIDVVYPHQHEALARRISEQGALLSEFPLGMPPHGPNFPRRNRIISGLALGVLVAEAPHKSGSLITVEAALEQGRDVFAVPHNIFNSHGEGCNQLIRDGAMLVTSAADILAELNVAYEHSSTQRQAEIILPENEDEAAIVMLLGADPLHIDDIIRLSGRPAEAVVAILTILELKGLALMVGHMQYCRAL